MLGIDRDQVVERVFDRLCEVYLNLSIWCCLFC